MGTFSAFLAKMTPHSSKLINKLGEIDYLEDIIHNAVSDMTEAAFDVGVATGGSSTTIVDTGKVWATNLWQDSWFSVTIAGKEYQGKVTSNTADTLTIPDITPAVVAVGCPYKLFQVVAASNIKMVNSAVQTADDWTVLFRNIVKKAQSLTQANVTCVAANTEYSYALPANCKEFSIRVRDGLPDNSLSISTVTGAVPPGTGLNITKITNDNVLSVDAVELLSTTLYFSNTLAGAVVEIIACS